MKPGRRHRAPQVFSRTRRYRRATGLSAPRQQRRMQKQRRPPAGPPSRGLKPFSPRGHSTLMNKAPLALPVVARKDRVIVALHSRPRAPAATLWLTAGCRMGRFRRWCRRVVPCGRPLQWHWHEQMMPGRWEARGVRARPRWPHSSAKLLLAQAPLTGYSSFNSNWLRGGGKESPPNHCPVGAWKDDGSHRPQPV